MSDDCTLRGKLAVQPGTTPDDVRAALLASVKRCEADFMASEIDDLLSADEMDENRIVLADDVADVCIQLRGTGGFLSREALAVAQAFNTLSSAPGWMVMTDHDLSADSEGSQMLYCVGATAHDKAVAKILYAMDQAGPYLKAAGVGAESVIRAQQAWIAEITPPGSLAGPGEDLGEGPTCG